MKRAVSRISAIFLTFLVVIWAAMMALNAQTDKPDAPAFNVTSLDGKQFDSASLRGKIVVVDFWFTGCPPCLEELPKLNSLVDEFKNKDIIFIAPTWDKEPTLRTFLKEYPFKYQIIPNAKALVLEACRDGEGNVEVPTHMVINRDGKVELKSVGGFTTEEGKKDYDNLRETLVRLLNAPPDKSK
ncbi:MAG TPA: TlpA disulfide reductase family protein [Pyrinomonadaceae bacterium]|nr:TlpA disulfide reductase family protein [Pyrinomonadaceae bacterium]